MKNIAFIILLLLSGVTTLFAQPSAKTDSIVYVCPPCGGGTCDNTSFDKPGTCKVCGMALVKITLGEFKKQANAKKLTICFYLQDGVEVLDFAGPMEVFITAGYDVFTVSKNYNIIRSKTVLFVTPNYSIKDAPPADILVVFGGPTQPTTDDPEVMDWIASRKSMTQYYMSVCTGAFILGKAGLLDNLTATTFHTQIEALRQAYPKTKVLANVRFVDNGTVMTTAGISAGIDGALHMVEKLRGREYAKGVAETIEYDKWVPDNGLVIGKN